MSKLFVLHICELLLHLRTFTETFFTNLRHTFVHLVHFYLMSVSFVFWRFTVPFFSALCFVLPRWHKVQSVSISVKYNGTWVEQLPASEIFFADSASMSLYLSVCLLLLEKRQTPLPPSLPHFINCVSLIHLKRQTCPLDWQVVHTIRQEDASLIGGFIINVKHPMGVGMVHYFWCGMGCGMYWWNSSQKKFKLQQATNFVLQISLSMKQFPVHKRDCHFLHSWSSFSWYTIVRCFPMDTLSVTSQLCFLEAVLQFPRKFVSFVMVIPVKNGNHGNRFITVLSILNLVK